MKPIMVKAQDSTELACYQFTCERPLARLFCLHGSSLNSRRYMMLAKICSQAGYEVILCDWRGHGLSQGEPGTCHYQGQLEDDLNDVVSYFSQKDNLPVVVGGHSAGAVITLRYIQKYGQKHISGCYLISPALANFLEISRFDSDSASKDFFVKFLRKKVNFSPMPESARQHLPRFSKSWFWIAYCLPFLRNKKILKFPVAEKMAKLEGRVTDYSFNMMTSVSIQNYVEAFRLLQVPTLLICGKEDEMLQPDAMSVIFHWHLSPELDKEIHMLDKIKHMNVINAASKPLTHWLSQRWNTESELAEQRRVS